MRGGQHRGGLSIGVEEAGQESGCEVRRWGSPENSPGFGLTELGFGRHFVRPDPLGTAKSSCATLKPIAPILARIRPNCVPHTADIGLDFAEISPTLGVVLAGATTSTRTSSGQVEDRCGGSW